MRQFTALSLVALMLAIFFAAGCASSSSVPELHRVNAVSMFGDSWGLHKTQGWARRDRIHVGVDYREPEGAPVLAAAGGIVHHFTNDTCGLSIKITHDSIGRSFQYPNRPQTVYCHLQEYAVEDGVRVERGAVIGKVGLTGTSGGVSHLHLEYWEKSPHLGVGDVLPDGALDPHSVMAGCFEPGREYPKDRFVLTYPVRCR